MVCLIASGARAVQTLIAGGVDGIDAKLAGADTVFVATAINRVILFMVAAPEIHHPDPEDIRLALSQVSEQNPRARRADPQDFVEPRLIREIEATGFIKRLYGEQGG